MPDPISPWDMAAAQSHYNRLNSYGPNGNVVYGHVGDDGQFVAGRGGRDQQQAMQTEETEFQRQLREGNEAGTLGLQSAVLGSYGLDGEGGGALPGVPQIEDQNGIAQQYFDANVGLLTEHFGRDQERMMGRMQNRGLPVGSAAYEDGMRPVMDAQNRALTGLSANAINYAGQEQSRRFGLGRQARDSAINEITGVTSGRFSPSPLVRGGSPSNIDVAGMMQSNYDAQMAQANARQAGRNAMFGNLFGIAGAALSDRRAKTDIRRVGKTDGGLPVYVYRYKGDSTMQMGVMAQEAQDKFPEAVVERPDGLLAVNYGEIH
ncbi:tail fiber domain-containing protein [Thalassobius sp. Cn5-15]|uniref:tail fiber domain-containing protein n=1 Tax=Thalassobius sp. Cn5-15 TaxID=2917763 RepID=UPI001EF36EB2|nr:tail fiber domain-containing protein [Thalassobius sp. Cn5-15]MCG7492464.1 tail fiber domain-containing protein [Thalassobius sp. Cn5-15]